MPYHIESDNESCNGFAVVKDSDGEVMGCHRNEDQASRQIAALYAAEDDAESESEATHTMPDGTVMPGASHPRADADAITQEQNDTDPMPNRTAAMEILAQTTTTR